MHIFYIIDDALPLSTLHLCSSSLILMCASLLGIYPAQYLHHPQSLYRDGCDPAVSGIHSSIMGRPSSCSTTSGNCCHVGSNSETPLHCSNGCWIQLSSTGMEYHKIRFPLLDKKVISLQYSLFRLLNLSSMQTDVLGRWSAQEEKEIRMLSRPDGSRLFQNLTRGNWYLIQAEGYLNNSASGQTSEMALTWNRTALPGGSVSVYYLIEQLKLSYSKCTFPHQTCIIR